MVRHTKNVISKKDSAQASRASGGKFFIVEAQGFGVLSHLV